jgi:hypothetical protein
VPLFVGVGYFPDSKDIKGHIAANTELSESFRLTGGGHVVFGGDLNAHTAANGDTRVDKAGCMLEATLESVGLVMVNKLANVCKDKFSRVEVGLHTTTRSTIDYVACSHSLVKHLVSLRFGDQMGSDHKPLVLTFEGFSSVRRVVARNRTMWRTENIVSPPQDWSWVIACRKVFDSWVTKTGSFVQALKAVGTESDRIADLLDWSFQLELDSIANQVLGRKTVRTAASPKVSAAIRILNDHRKASEAIMLQCMDSGNASDEDVYLARSNFLKSRRAMLAAGRRDRQLAELRLFRDIESNQSNSRLFWRRVKALRSSSHCAKAPPDIVQDIDGNVVTDPIAVLRVWRDFCSQISSASLAGTREEGIYNEDYYNSVNEELAKLNSIRLFQAELDSPFSEDEVFAAIRAMNAGTAPGEDGILIDILRSAADAVNNSNLRAGNSVVSALTLMFNYVLENECWPRRWRTGIIFPLYKGDSRLDPGNYRPITLLSVVGKTFGRVINNRLSKWSESREAMADEQGGFRPDRGTIDQLFILTELLQSRKDRGFATYTTFIDIRKAYDTVWREGAFVNLHKMGVRGKLWRQLQAMNKGLTRSIHTSFGNTAPFDVERGVAQGAVESPWLYSSFINGLVEDLKSHNLGVMVAGRRLPILLYADDIVLLASSAEELHAMNKIVSAYARNHRFQINGGKSAVMVFNVTRGHRNQLRKQRWSVFGERITIRDEYKYLGLIIRNNTTDWSVYMDSLIKKARASASYLLWSCKYGNGLRPRSAITLWQAIVRPMLEYGSEIFSVHVSQSWVNKVERVQSNFVKSVLGIAPSAPNVFALCEVGLERVQSRWDKLRLGYWRHLCLAKHTRFLYLFAAFRKREAGRVQHRHSWMKSTRALCDSLRIPTRFWDFTLAHHNTRKSYWHGLTHEAVDWPENISVQQKVLNLSSLRLYHVIKNWSSCDEVNAAFSSEIGRLGMRVCEKYLDDRREIKATQLKTRCRGNCIAVMDRVGREHNWPKLSRVCLACDTNEVETVAHLVLSCPRYVSLRANLFDRVRILLDRVSAFDCHHWRGTVYSSLAPSWSEFLAADGDSKLCYLLGKSMGDPFVENGVDMAFKRFIKQVWNTRKPITEAINMYLGRND